MSALPAEVSAEPFVDDVEAVLAYHDQDSRAAIETLLADCRHLRQQLSLTAGAMSRGFTRGWQPTFTKE